MSTPERTAALVRTLQSVVTFGTGAPVAAPQAPRGIFIRLDGGAGSTLYVWEGGPSWRSI